jgi:hypothetical protein
MSTSFEPQFNAQSEMSDPMLTRDMLSSAGTAARAGVVNRTHRVVRQRAKVMQERRSQVRSLMVPLIICSALLILVIIAVWSGLYQYEAAEAAEAVQADVAALAATTDANNHFLVVLLWFVPVSMAVMAAVWLRRVRSSADHRTTR